MVKIVYKYSFLNNKNLSCFRRLRLLTIWIEEEKTFSLYQKSIKNSATIFHHDKKQPLFAMRNKLSLLTALRRSQSRTRFDFDSGGAPRSAR
jgi:hypothetical protein